MYVRFLEESLEVLERTPAVLDGMLRGLGDAWTRCVDGPGTWSAYDVVGHLIHGERTDWMPRLAIILEYGAERPFDPFDREAQVGERRRLEELLDEFRVLRMGSIERLRGMALTEEQLELVGMHPALGRVTVRQLIATWVAHDLSHIVQVGRTMARRYRGEVGPWAEYLSLMR